MLGFERTGDGGGEGTAERSQEREWEPRACCPRRLEWAARKVLMLSWKIFVLSFVYFILGIWVFCLCV